MSENAHKEDGFVKRVALSYSGSALVLLLAGGLALYLMDQLGAAVEQAISDILPKTLIATRLSEHSALLAASAPKLTSAGDRDHTQQIGADLDLLKSQLIDDVTRLTEISDSQRLGQIKHNVEVITEALSRLKHATEERIVLDDRHTAALARVRQVHAELEDTISPVVWGVSSLSRLFGKRTARLNTSNIRELGDRQVPILIMLLELQHAYQVFAANAQDAGLLPANGQQEALRPAWRRLRPHLESRTGETDSVYQSLLDAGIVLIEQGTPDAQAVTPQADSGFGSLLSRALTHARATTRARFVQTAQTADDTVTRLVDKTVNDMGDALNIKAEGNLLFALLAAVADADSQESVTNLQDRFKRSLAAFRQSASDFRNSSLARRNPILAGTVTTIEGRLNAFENDPNSLFGIRREQLATGALSEEILSSNRIVTARLNHEVDSLVNEVQTDADALRQQMEKIRGANRLLLILVFLVGLVLTGMIALFSIKALLKQQRTIRQAATVFESTGEGVIILDPGFRIIAVNSAFSTNSGHDKNKIIGRHVRLLHSRRHDRFFYRRINEALAETGRWQGEVFTRKNNGELELDWLTVNAVRNRQGEIAQYVAVFSDVAIVKRSLQKLDHLAHHDALTGLPNRLLLQDRIEHAIPRALRERRHLAVLFLDLDRFKNVNDTLGHKVGDDLLCIVGDRLTEKVRRGDTVARLGGDEFTILLEDYRSAQDARSVAQKVLDAFKEPIVINGQELFVTASIGISIFPGDGTSVDELVRNVDAAMYRAKEEGKNNYQFYTSDLTIAVREKLRLESSLRLAVERGEFELHYQPKWDTGSGEITGVEALLRWRHPEHGIVGPAGFIETLEDCGLILQLGTWILQTACVQSQAWCEQGLPPVQMSVNISGRQIGQGDLLNTVKSCLAKSGMNPEYLELEITEGFVMQQPEEVIVLLGSIRDLGVRIAIDDFGTGYSSLSYLKQLPVQKLKIDRSFVKDIPGDLDDVAITRAIIALGLRLNMSIVAEGVETEDQLAFLRQEGCTEAQGYLFSKPVPAPEIQNLLDNADAGVPCRLKNWCIPCSRNDIGDEARKSTHPADKGE